MSFLIAAAAFVLGYGIGRREALLRHFESIWRKENRRFLEDLRGGRIGRRNEPKAPTETPE